MTEQDADEDDFDVFEGANPKTEDLDSGADWIAMPSAGLLDVAQADELLRWRDANIVAIVGELNGGKTTLAAELYERFLRGAFKDLIFSHSLTLHGFEEKCFEARAASGRTIPHTPRTSAQDELSFFHLGVLSTGAGCRTDLLISERAGEVYRDVRDSPATAERLIEVAKADVVVFVIDGAQVADARQRSEAFASVRHLVKALAQTAWAKPGTRYQFVTTKWDKLRADEYSAARDALTAFEEQLAGSFPQAARPQVFQVAARDPTGVLAPGYGLEELLSSWVGEAPCRSAVQPKDPTTDSEFDMLYFRTS